jgi:hypothetical protein
MDLFVPSLLILFFTTLFISGILVFKNQPSITYTYTKNEISSKEIANNINLL